MSPKSLSLSATKQRGFLIPLAAFVVIIMGVLAMTMSRVTSQTGVGATLEGVSTQAFYAAESGAQHAMYQLFFNKFTRAAVDNSCNGMTNVINYSVTGLTTCSANLSCTIANDAGNTTSFYTITSTGSCGAGQISAQRIVQVSAFMQ